MNFSRAPLDGHDQTSTQVLHNVVVIFERKQSRIASVA